MIQQPKILCMGVTDSSISTFHIDNDDVSIIYIFVERIADIRFLTQEYRSY